MGRRRQKKTNGLNSWNTPQPMHSSSCAAVAVRGLACHRRLLATCVLSDAAETPHGPANLRMAFGGAKDDRNCDGWRGGAANPLSRPSWRSSVPFSAGGHQCPHIQKYRPRTWRACSRRPRTSIPDRVVYLCHPTFGNWNCSPMPAAWSAFHSLLWCAAGQCLSGKAAVCQSHGDGQMIIPRKCFLVLGGAPQGKSIGILPDQSQKKGIAVRFSTPAMTTPVPALLPSCTSGQSCGGLLAKSGKRALKLLFPIPSAGITPVKSGDPSPDRGDESPDGVHYPPPPRAVLLDHNRWKTYRTKKEFLPEKKHICVPTAMNALIVHPSDSNPPAPFAKGQGDFHGKKTIPSSIGLIRFAHARMAGTDILAASTGDCRQLPQLTVQEVLLSKIIENWK